MSPEHFSATSSIGVLTNALWHSKAGVFGGGTCLSSAFFLVSLVRVSLRKCSALRVSSGGGLGVLDAWHGALLSHPPLVNVAPPAARSSASMADESDPTKGQAEGKDANQAADSYNHVRVCVVCQGRALLAPGSVARTGTPTYPC